MLDGRGRRRRGTAMLMAAMVLAGAGCDQHSPTAQDPPETDLALARRATSRYQDVSVALREGYVADPVCVASPAGAMGIHYLNHTRMDEASVTPREPEILLYAREGGTVRLVGVEYFKPVLENGRPYFGLTPPANPGPTPELFGQAFQGPMPGHNPSMPWHWDLHVWIWQDNPAGTFAQFNPAVSCS